MSTSSPAIDQIFAEALHLPAGNERAAFVHAACGTNVQVRERVERLLCAYGDAESFLDVPAANREQATLSSPERERLGTQIGPFKLLQQIGEGGMGTVYLAEQTQPVQRKVALKLIKAGLDSRQVIARFEAERQALAMMDHASIARVLDAGATEAGKPYFVMELVHGVPITKYCDDNRLTPRQRLELFVPVCQAIQHAHQKGIIHRDIKPSNVMVTQYDGQPVPKVIDFGVAKATEQKLTEQTLFTQYGTRVGTLEYMSPEQAEMSALGVDTRSDIYSLGVLLYELLTGSTPLGSKRMKEAGQAEILRLIREEEPAKPSTRLSESGETLASISAQRQMEPTKLTNLVRGELDWIVMKTLEKDRNRRYETASGLVADVQRYLNDEPVEACPPSAWYRFRKFARRNKAVLSMLACALAVVVTVAGSLGWIVRDRASRDLALDRVVTLTLDEADELIEKANWPEAQATVQRADNLLSSAGRPRDVPRIRELTIDLALAQRLEDIYVRPKTEEFYTGHELDAAYAQVFIDAGIDVAALPLAEAAERIRARSIWREFARGLDIWAGMRQRAGNQEAPNWKRLLEIAEAADPDPWRNPMREAQRRGDGKALTDLAASADVARLRPETLHLLAGALHGNGAQGQALALLRQAQVQYPEDWWISHLLGSYCLSATLPQYDEALRYYTAAQALRPQNPYNLRAISEAMLGKKAFAEAVVFSSRAIDLKPEDASLWAYRSYAFFKCGQHEKAVGDCSQAIELDPKYAWAWGHRARARNELGQRDKAIADYSESIQLDPKQSGVWCNRGAVFNSLGQVDQALADYTQAIELDPKNVAAWANRGALFCDTLDQLDKAVADFNQAIVVDPRHAAAWHNRGVAYNKLNRWDQALADFSQAIELDPQHTAAWNNRGRVHGKLLHWDRAVADYSQAIELDPKYVTAWRNRGAVYCDNLGQLDKAVADFSRAIELDSKRESSWHNRGLAYQKLRQWDQALADYSQAIELDPKSVSAWTNRGLVHGILGQWAKAGADYARLVTLAPDNVEAAKQLAYCQVQQGRYQEALDIYLQIVERYPKDADTHNDLAVFLAACPDPKFRDPIRAVELATTAAALTPAEGRVWNTLGMAHIRAGDWQAGVAALQKSEELEHSNVNGWFYRAMGHWRLDQKDEARKWYDRAVAWMGENPQALPKHLRETDVLNRLRAEAAELLEMK